MENNHEVLRNAYLDKDDSALKVSVQNLSGFAELLKEVEQKADELQEAINRLARFELKVKFDYY